MCTVMHNPIMYRGAPGIVGFPSDNRQILRCQLNLRTFDNPYSCGRWVRWIFPS
jgi:hypothetical protein